MKTCETCTGWNGKLANPFCEDFDAIITTNKDGYMRRVFDCLQADIPKPKIIKDMREKKK
jgi:hypothetical protein